MQIVKHADKWTNTWTSEFNYGTNKHAVRFIDTFFFLQNLEDKKHVHQDVCNTVSK